MGHSINLMADDLARQVKKHRDKRRGRREAQKAGQQPHPPDLSPRGFPSGIEPREPCYRSSNVPPRPCTRGESKKFKHFERNVARINDFEPELELESDEELRQRYQSLRERHLAGEPLEDLLYESFALTREAGKRARAAPLRRPADRRHGAARRLDRGDEDGRGQDAYGDLADRAERARPRDENGHPVRGKGVHLVTVNDYLARRDANWMKPIYDLLA